MVSASPSLQNSGRHFFTTIESNLRELANPGPVLPLPGSSRRIARGESPRQTCSTSRPNSLSRSSALRCAPGYAPSASLSPLRVDSRGEKTYRSRSVSCLYRSSGENR